MNDAIVSVAPGCAAILYTVQYYYYLPLAGLETGAPEPPDEDPELLPDDGV